MLSSTGVTVDGDLALSLDPLGLGRGDSICCGSLISSAEAAEGEDQSQRREEE